MIMGKREYPYIMKQTLISPKFAMLLIFFLVCPLSLCWDEMFKGESQYIFMFFYLKKNTFDIIFCHVDQFVLNGFAWWALRSFCTGFILLFEMHIRRYICDLWQ